MSQPIDTIAFIKSLNLSSADMLHIIKNILERETDPAIIDKIGRMLVVVLRDSGADMTSYGDLSQYACPNCGKIECDGCEKKEEEKDILHVSNWGHLVPESRCETCREPRCYKGEDLCVCVRCETCGELADGDCDCFECEDCEGKFEGDCVCPRDADPEGDDVMLCGTCAEDRETKTKTVVERWERLTLALLSK
jgi:hypothetical protein